MRRRFYINCPFSCSSSPHIDLDSASLSSFLLVLLFRLSSLLHAYAHVCLALCSPVSPARSTTSLACSTPILVHSQRHLLPRPAITLPASAHEQRSRPRHAPSKKKDPFFPPSKSCLIHPPRTTPITLMSAPLPGTMARGRRGETQVRPFFFAVEIERKKRRRKREKTKKISQEKVTNKQNPC